MTPCVWLLTASLCEFRREKLLRKNINTVNNPYEVELHTRFLMLSKPEGYKTEDKDLIDEIEEFYYQAERKFPNSSILKVFVAQFHLTYRNRQEALPKLAQAEERNPQLDEQFIIYKIRQSAEGDAISLVTFSSYLESAHKLETNALDGQVNFWRELGKSSNTSFDALTKLAKGITKNIDTVSNYYQYLMNIDRTHKKMLPMYVYFLQDVMHREDLEVKNLRNRLQDLRSENAENIMPKENWVYEPELQISIDRKTFGNIQKINPSMLSWVQLPKASMMNQNVSTVMPLAFGKFFLTYLSDINDDMEETINIPPIDVNFLDKDGYVVTALCSFSLPVIEASAISRNKTGNSDVLELPSALESRRPSTAYAAQNSLLRR